MGNFWNTTKWEIGAELLKNILEDGEFLKREISAVEYVKATIWGIAHIEACMRNSELNIWRLLYNSLVPIHLSSTPKLEAVIKQNISNTSKIGGCYRIVQFQHICSEINIWRLLYNSIFPTHLFSTPKLEAVIKQNISNTFVLNSKIGGSYTIYSSNIFVLYSKFGGCYTTE